MTVVMESHETRALLHKAQQGDRASFDRLVKAHRQRLEALIHSRLGARLKRVFDADDVLQETLVRALVSMDRFRWQGDDSFMRWLGGSAASPST